VLVNDSDPNGDVLTITAATPTNGTVSIAGTNLSFLPATNFVGTATIGYTISDGSLSATAIVTVNVTPVNDPPVAVNDSYTVLQGSTLVVAASGVLTNDSDAEDDALTAILVSNPSHGTLVLSGDGAFTYTPTNHDVGSDSFTYRANDGGASSGIATVTIIFTPLADIAVTKNGPASVAAGSNLTYTVSVTNLGPGTAANVVAVDDLPVNAVFVSASSGGTLSNNAVAWPAVSAFPRGFVTNYTVTVTAPGSGTLVNIARATSATEDPDGSNTTSRVTTTVIPGPQFGLLASPAIFNPQTGLFEERVTVTNIGLSTVAAVRLYVSGLRSNVFFHNPSGTNNGIPYAQNNSPLNPAQTAVFMLEFYVPDRRPFTNALAAEGVLPEPKTTSTGTNTGPGMNISRVFVDSRQPGNPRLVIEFSSVRGRVYTILYSDDLTTWKVATPSVTASANVTQWYDDGPPKTESKPLTAGSRYYRVLVAPNP
jgi:uncharacterized repeat protein (TIGR01451 family)